MHVHYGHAFFYPGSQTLKVCLFHCYLSYNLTNNSKYEKRHHYFFFKDTLEGLALRLESNNDLASRWRFLRSTYLTPI